MANFLRSGIGQALTGTIGGQLVGPPKPKPPPLMPDPNDPLALARQRQTLARTAAAGSGRNSTIISGNGGNYQATALGG